MGRSQMKRRLAVLDKKLEHYGKLLDGKKDTWDHAYMQNLIWKGKKMTSRKVWFVTGCSKGLGHALVKKLLEEGYPVAATSRDA